jgi:hypothetical protein
LSALTLETDDEIVATAMLLGAEFEQYPRDTPALWRCQNTGWHWQKRDGAIAFLHKRGFRLDFNGNIQEAT